MVCYYRVTELKWFHDLETNPKVAGIQFIHDSKDAQILCLVRCNYIIEFYFKL